VRPLWRWPCDESRSCAQTLVPVIRMMMVKYLSLTHWLPSQPPRRWSPHSLRFQVLPACLPACLPPLAVPVTAWERVLLLKTEVKLLQILAQLSEVSILRSHRRSTISGRTDASRWRWCSPRDVRMCSCLAWRNTTIGRFVRRSVQMFCESSSVSNRGWAGVGVSQSRHLRCRRGAMTSVAAAERSKPPPRSR
jgi:hypothetical protein